VSLPPKVVVLGRQNVGKSTLVNRLYGRRLAIADDAPGITRDRVEIEASWRGRRFALVDTAGYLPRARGVEARAAEQSMVAVSEADVVLLVVDVQTGVSEDDAALARRLRSSPAPVLVVANKADKDADETEAAGFNRLGLGEPVTVSALQGRGAGDLLDRIVDLLPTADGGAGEPGPDPLPRFAIVGRPNVGKSSLFNRLLGQDRSVVYEEAGTTRDAVDAVVEWPGSGSVRFVDTAGMRRGQSVRGVEYYSFLRAAKAIERADVAVVVIDAAEGFTSEDKRIVNRVVEAGRAFLLVANKWDLVEERARRYEELREMVGPFARAPVQRTSAASGQGVHRLPPVLIDLHHRWNVRVSTAAVNQTVQRAQGERPAPRTAGTIKYATQVSAGPPTFVLFGSGRPPDPSYRRFLENRLRAEFGFEGVPIRLRFRRRSAGTDA
jgi:GTPase